ncbi:MAG: hypothetical protein KJN62_05240, partial [Deltaproteobacteria bacterium]|nr:hypothetical protein [Deltaproteobacteria bacterium]
MYLSDVQTNAMISENFNKARHGSLTGNGCGGSIATIEHPSPGSFIMNHYKEGDKIGSCVFIRRTGFKPSRALFRCECGNEFETAITSV